MFEGGDTGSGEARGAVPEAELLLARTMIENAAEAIFHLDDEGRTTFLNASAEQMFGWRKDELLGRKLHDMVHYKHPDGSPFPMAECPLGHVFASGQTLTDHEDTFFRKDGSAVAVSCSNAAIMRDGRVAGSVLIVRDETERHRAEAHRQLLVNELNHRVKNTLSIVQSIARQTFRDAEDGADLAAFEARLAALSAAHNVLTEETWSAASVDAIVRRALQPFAVAAGRIEVSGPHARLAPRAAVDLALAIHELATNASKYGALSGESGRVRLLWELEPTEAGRHFRLVWEERDGPEVSAPKRRGFGSRMIERALAAEFGAALLEFLPGGVRFTVEGPYTSVGEGAV